MLDFLKLESFSLSWKVLNVVLPKRSYLHRMGTLELHFLQLQIEYSQLKFPTPQFPNYTFELPVKFLRITLSPFVFRKNDSESYLNNDFEL